MPAGAFIALGAVLLELLSFMFLVFGLALIWTAVRLLAHRDAEPDVASGGATVLGGWVLRVAAYASLMTDEYPPFRLDMVGAEPSPEPRDPVGPAGTTEA